MERLPSAGVAAFLTSAISAMAALPAGARADGVIDLDERRPILMLAMTPSGQNANVRSPDLYRAADEAVRARTTLFVRSPEQAGVELQQFAACPLETRMTCWVSLARSIAPAYLLVVSIHPQADRSDKLTSLLIDVGWATRELDQIGGVESGLEDRIFERSASTKPAVVHADRPSELAKYFTSLFAEELAPALETARDPFGTIAIAGAPNGIAIELDGRTIGSTSEARTEIHGVQPRPRKLVLSDPTGRHAAFSRDVIVEPGRTSDVLAELALVAPVEDRLVTPRRAVIWSGAGVAAIGAAIAIYAIASAPRAKSIDPCFGASCPEETSQTFATFCELGADDVSKCGGGVLAAPLGYSLALAGGAAAAGAWSFDEDDRVPWLPIVAGVLLGGSAYALSAALQ